jgi:uncharacterized phage protein (TIGR02216 family)
LRLPSDAFWKMTLRELACATQAVNGCGGAPLDRADLERMMARFPDAR